MGRLTVVAGAIALVAFALTLDRTVAWVAAPVYERATLKAGADYWNGLTRSETPVNERWIPALLPGPSDRWAGGETKTVALTVPLPPDLGRGWILTLRLYDSHDTDPPVLAIAAGKEAPTVVAIRPGHGSANWQAEGLTSHVEIPVSHEAAVDGRLPVTIDSRSGAWVAIKEATVAAAVPAWEYDAAVALWSLLAVGYAVVATRRRLWRSHAETVARRFAAAVDGVATRIGTPGRAAFFVFVAVHLLFGLQREWIVPHDADFDRRYYFMVGDEPEYFLGAWSLAYDGDTNIRNNVADGDWRAFWNQQVWDFYFGSLPHFKTISPAMADVPESAWAGEQLMVHRPGMSALLFPAAYSVERFRWTGYLITTTTAAAALAALVWLAATAGAPPAGAALIALLFVATPPPFFYVNQAFPEATVGLWLALVTTLLVDGRRPALIVAALFVVALPWFSDRGLLAAATLGVGALFVARDARTRVVLVAIYVAGAAALARYYLHRFGVPWPVDHNPYGKASLSHIPFNFPALFLDGAKGILFLAPMTVGAAAAYVAWYRSGIARPVFWLNGIGLTLTIVVTTSNLDWWGGGCPAGRYGVIPLWMTFPAWLVWIRTGVAFRQRLLLAPLFAYGLAESLLLFTRLPWWHADFNPLFHYEWTAVADGLFPDFMSDGGATVGSAAAWGAFFLLWALATVLAGRRGSR